jgi:hypothetical protein
MRCDSTGQDLKDPPPEGVDLVYPVLFLSELKIALLSLMFTLFLILHVQADFFGIQSYGVDTIASGPEMVAPHTAFASDDETC